MALALNSEECFTALKTATKALRRGDVATSTRMLRTLHSQGQRIKNQAIELRRELEELEESNTQEMETVKCHLGDLEDQERSLLHERQRLEKHQDFLQAKIDSCVKILKTAVEEEDAAKRKLREAEEKCKELENWWWVPIYGQFLFFRELLEDNHNKARRASCEVTFHRSCIRRTDLEIENNTALMKDNEKKINSIACSISQLRIRMEYLHDKAGALKEIIVFIMEAEVFWQQLADSSYSASVNASSLERLVQIAIRKCDLKILNSKGTERVVGSFENTWNIVLKMLRNQFRHTPFNSLKN